MNKLICEMCGSSELIKQDGVFMCQVCGCKYSVEEAKRMMVEGIVDIQGTVKVDNSAFVEKYLANARRAYEKEDWEEVEKYYNMVEQNAPNNIEAVFFSALAKVLLSYTDRDYYKRDQKFKVLHKSISVINDYYEETIEDKEAVLKKIADAISKVYSATSICSSASTTGYVGDRGWQNKMQDATRDAYITELKQIYQVHKDAYIQVLINKVSSLEVEKPNSGCGCYVATAVYGSYDCAEVWTLRRFRDECLAKSWYGRTFIHIYYAVSPVLVGWFGDTKWFKKMWKGTLDSMVKNLQEKGYASTPYKDIDWR